MCRVPPARGGDFQGMGKSIEPDRGEEDVDDPQFGPTPTWFDPGTFGQSTMDELLANGQPGMFGYMGRNVLRGPGRNNWDIALLKEFSLLWSGADRSTLQFRLETFNTFNHPQWQGVRASSAGNTPPGAPCSGRDNISNGQIVSAWPARVMQLLEAVTWLLRTRFSILESSAPHVLDFRRNPSKLGNRNHSIAALRQDEKPLRVGF